MQQAQAVRTEQNAVTAQQSLTAVKTLIKAGLGCITYLRNLLPGENFARPHLTSESTPGSFDTSSSNDDRKTISGYDIRVVRKGVSKEGDMLVDYLDGIFDALEKQYLRRFIFAIYLDKEIPTNIVEAYTFNFTYHSSPGSDVKVPVLSLSSLDRLDNKLNHMSLNDNAIDPVRTAADQGRAPTLREVKMSLRSLVTRLILSTQGMGNLPHYRLATFKLFYNEGTPDEYEPPHFVPGDAERDKYVFSTHSKGEVPERISVGSVQTNHHGVSIEIASVSGFLPSLEEDDAQFSGLSHQGLQQTSTSTSGQVLALKSQQKQIQKADALKRTVVWDAEEATTMDHGETVDDVEHGNHEASVVELSQSLRIQPTFSQLMHAMDTDETEYVGKRESIPNHISKMLEKLDTVPATQATQLLEDTQSTTSGPILNEPSQVSTLQVQEAAIQMFGDQETCETLIVDTQPAFTQLETSLGSLPSIEVPMEIDSARSKLITRPNRQPVTRKTSRGHKSIDCSCGVSIDDCGSYQCDNCQKRLHIWCMGYHSARDDRVPESFICMDCRLQRDPNSGMLDAQGRLRVVSNIHELALFRRALKLLEIHQPQTLTVFKKVLGCDAAMAGHVWKRLEAEEFIAPLETDDIGLLETAQLKGKGKKKPKGRATPLKRPKFTSLIPTSKRAFDKYFDAGTEKKLLGLNFIVSTMVHVSRQEQDTPSTRGNATPGPSHHSARDEPQFRSALVHDGEFQAKCSPTSKSKRKGTQENGSRSRKKIKVSVVSAGVELDM